MTNTNIDFQRIATVSARSTTEHRLTILEFMFQSATYIWNYSRNRFEPRLPPQFINGPRRICTRQIHNVLGNYSAFVMWTSLTRSNDFWSLSLKYAKMCRMQVSTHWVFACPVAWIGSFQILFPGAVHGVKPRQNCVTPRGCSLTWWHNPISIFVRLL